MQQNWKKTARVVFAAVALVLLLFSVGVWGLMRVRYLWVDHLDLSPRLYLTCTEPGGHWLLYDRDAAGSAVPRSIKGPGYGLVDVDQDGANLVVSYRDGDPDWVLHYACYDISTVSHFETTSMAEVAAWWRLRTGREYRPVKVLEFVRITLDRPKRTK